MKKLIVSATFFALFSACSPAAEEAAAPVEEVVEAPTLETYAGNWNMTGADGATWTVALSSDGAMVRTMADATTSNASVTVEGDQLCVTDEGATEAVCYTTSEEDITGSMTLTTADGAVTTARRAVEGVEAAPGADAEAAAATETM